MKFHPYSEIFPLLDGEALAEFALDIKTNGLREKIWLYDGQILDGRNRFMACQKAKIKPEYRKYTGKDPLAFVVSLNIARRHLTFEQRLMAAAKVATLRKGDNQHTARAVSSQAETAEAFGVSVDSVQRARKVVERGSKALQNAVESGDVPVRKAASVVDLPKSQQLAAATKKPEPESPPEKWEPDADEEAMAEQFEKNYAASLDKIMAADDKLAAAHAEIKRQAAEIATLTLSRDGYMNGRSEMLRLLKKVQNRNLRLEKELGQLRGNRAA